MRARFFFPPLFRAPAFRAAAQGLAAGFIGLLCGCSLLANPRTAEIRPEGQQEWGLSLGSSNAGLLGRTARDPSLFLSRSAPVLLPEVCFAQSLSPDWEMGGRVSLTALGIEGYAKWGLFQGQRWNLALAPLLGHGNLDPGTMAYAEIPLLATLRRNERVALHGSLFSGFAKAVGDLWGEIPLPQLDRTVGSAHYWGLGMGFEVGRERWIVRPLLESSILAPRGAADWPAFWRTDFTVNFSWSFAPASRE